ncbi:MAG: YciI family protein [Dehalococcoidia bacterium]
MQYLLLIYHDEAFEAAKPPADQEALMGAYWKLEEALQAESGVRIAGEALYPVGTAKTVRIRDGKNITSDGPFAETKEQLGGFYLLDVENEAAALEWAAKIPSVYDGSVEVRQVMVFEQP